MSNVVRKEGPKPELESARQTASATTQLLLHPELAAVDLAAPHRTLWATKTASVKAQVITFDRFQLLSICAIPLCDLELPVRHVKTLSW